MGVGLLFLGDKVSELKTILTQMNEWAMSVMRIVLLTIPALPFLSIMTAIAKGNGKELIRGWKFVAAFMMAAITGTPVSHTFLAILIIVTLELSIASPGTASAWTIIFGTFGMPTSYIGLFTAYRLLTVNYSAACTEAYYILEEIEAAHKLGGVEQAA